MIRIQKHPFDPAQETERLKKNKNIGATVAFIGTVREISDDGEKISELFLEHYPEMTENILKNIETRIKKKFNVENTLIIHRYGYLKPSEDIVLVIVQTQNRKDAFNAAQYAMDALKSNATFWKAEYVKGKKKWLKPKKYDQNNITI